MTIYNDLSSTNDFGAVRKQASFPNKLKVTDHFHAFLPAKVDLNPANVEAEDWQPLL